MQVVQSIRTLTQQPSMIAPRPTCGLHAARTNGAAWVGAVRAPRKYGRSSTTAAAATPVSPATTAATTAQAPSNGSADAPSVAVSLFPSAAAGHFIDNNRAFVQEFPVRGYEVAPDQKASMVTITNLLQELAANHAVGMWGRAEKGFAGLPDAPNIVFVMTRLQVRMFQYPKWGDILRLQTFFAEEGRLAARRDWLVEDATTGQQIGAATSNWVNINMETRRLTKLPDDIKARFMRLAVPGDKHSLPVAETKKKLPDVNDQMQVQGPAQIARRSDMDMNGHINNVVYVAWVLEGVPADIYDKYNLYEMEIDYKAECQAGDTVQTSVERLAGADGAATVQLLHSLKRCGENGATELVRARSTWHLGSA